MNLFCLPVHLFAQAESVVTQAAPAVVSAATEAASAATTLVLPWYRQGSMMLPITVLTIAVPTLLAWLLSKRLRAADMWGRMATVLVALTAGIVIMAMGWPPRLGIDLKGGVILVYEIDASKRVKGEVDDCIGKIEQLLEKQEEFSETRWIRGERVHRRRAWFFRMPVAGLTRSTEEVNFCCFQLAASLHPQQPSSLRGLGKLGSLESELA